MCTFENGCIWVEVAMFAVSVACIYLAIWLYRRNKNKASLNVQETQSLPMDEATIDATPFEIMVDTMKKNLEGGEELEEMPTGVYPKKFKMSWHRVTFLIEEHMEGYLEFSVYVSQRRGKPNNSDLAYVAEVLDVLGGLHKTLALIADLEPVIVCQGTVAMKDPNWKNGVMTGLRKQANRP